MLAEHAANASIAKLFCNNIPDLPPIPLRG